MKLHDSVWHRVVQIVQEAMLTGVDCADLLRQVEVVQSSEKDSSDFLVLTEEYKNRVEQQHKELLSKAESRSILSGPRNRVS